MGKLIPSFLRFILGETLVIVGYVYAFIAVIAIVESQPIQVFPIEILNNPIVLYAACDIVIFIGTFIGKIPFHHPGKVKNFRDFIAWLLYLVIFPVAHLFMNTFYLIKGIFRLPAILSGKNQTPQAPQPTQKTPQKNARPSQRPQPQAHPSIQGQAYSTSQPTRPAQQTRAIPVAHASNMDDGLNALNNQLYTLCNRKKGRALPSLAVSVDYSVTHVLRRGTISFTLGVEASIRKDYLTSEYEAHNARESISDFLENFNVEELYEEVSELIDKLQEQYSGLDCEWNFRWSHKVTPKMI